MSFQKAVLPFLMAVALFCLFISEKKQPSEPFEPFIAEQQPSDRLTPVSFAALKGWTDDDLIQALPALRRSCAAVLEKKQGWQDVCRALADKEFKSSAQLRAFLEENFTPYAVDDRKEGIFTGYYEPELQASLTKTKRFAVPLYEIPADMVTVRVGDFSKENNGLVLFGKIRGTVLKPYLTRAEIEKNVLPAKVIAYVEHKADAFIMQIQGSGILVLPDGEKLRLSYAANNGHPFIGIGSVMLQAGLLKKGKADMASIRRWLIAHPEKADALMHRNARYIFFKVNRTAGAIGALGVVLTPERSLAVDPRYIPLGSFLWLETQKPEMNRLVSAQDTGEAIKGVVRGDFFYGAGTNAFKKAAVMKSKGVYFMLLPKKLSEKSV